MSQQFSGLSLSQCVADICRGSVNESQVEKILVGSPFPTLAAFINTVNDYCKDYWADFPEKAKEVAIRLWNSGKIDQQYAQGRSVYTGHGAWMDQSHQIYRAQKNGLMPTGKKFGYV